MKKGIFFVVCLVLAIFLTACGGQKKEAKENFDEYVINMDYEDNTLKVRQNIITDNKCAVDGIIKLIMYPYAYIKEGEAYFDLPTEYCAVNFDGIKFNGVQIPMSVNKCVITLSNLKTEKSNNIELEYTLDLPYGNYEFGRYRDSINLVRFYPTIAPKKDGQFYTPQYSKTGGNITNNVADYEVKLSIDQKYKVATNTEVVTNTLSNGKNHYIFNGQLRDCVFICNQNFQIKTATEGEVTVDYYYVKDMMDITNMQTLCQGIKGYSNLYGEYKHKKVTMINDGDYRQRTPLSGMVFLEKAEAQKSIESHLAEQWFDSVDNMSQGYFLAGLIGYSRCVLPLALGNIELHKTELCSLKIRLKEYQMRYNQYDEHNRAPMNATTDAYSVTQFRTVVADVNTLRLITLSEIVGYNVVLGAIKESVKDAGKNYCYQDFISAVNKATNTDCNRLLSAFDDNKILILDKI